MICRVFFTLAVCAAACRAALGVTIQPNEPASDDVFAYQFLSTSNWDTGPFAGLLAAGKTVSGHDTESFLKFDLTSVPYAPSEVTSATLSVYVGDTSTTGFGSNPTAVSPAQVDLYPITAAWVEGTLNWNTKPTIAGVATDSLSVTGISQWIDFDVTSLVVDWLDGSLTNNGLSLVMGAVAAVPSTAVVFDSSAGTNKPVLTVVPEPSCALLALLAVPALAWAGWRRAGRTAKSR